MTMEHSSLGGATLVKQPITTEELRTQLKCRSGRAVLQDSSMLEASNEKIIDEEVTSIESGVNNLDGADDDNYKVEQAMFNAALVHSVVDSNCDSFEKLTTGNVVVAESQESSCNRYGLRKRRRAPPLVVGSDLKKPEKHSSTRTNTTIPSEIVKKPHEIPVSNVVQQPKSRRKSKKYQPELCIDEGKEKQVKQSPTRTNHPPLFPTMSSVPNPLATLPVVDYPNQVSFSSFPTHNPSTSPSHTNASSSTKVAENVPSSLNVVQSSMSAVQPDFVPSVQARDFVGTDPVDQKARVTFRETTFDNRERGFSIDLDMALGLTEEQPGTESNYLNLANGSRDRAYSFECFAFGLNSNEQLPPLEHSSSNAQDEIQRRPRGDSIIFDPASFQDGGIHELSALERARSLSIDNVDSLVDELLDGVPSGIGAIENHLPIDQSVSAEPQINVQPTNINVPLTQEPTTGMPSSLNVFACGSLPYEILNKDGRIGIYPPDARRDRIARFHAKRSKRIWRKRIKYDCRKKLADSRPRIKGRFVKRLDEPED